MKNSNENVINIGMIGLGYIGTGVFKLIERQKSYIAQNTGKLLNIVKVADKDIKLRVPEGE